MLKARKNNKVIMVLIFIMTILLCKDVYAASATVSASKTQANVGDEITIITTIKGAAWQVSLSGAVSETYADNTDNAEDTTITKKITFTPTKADTYTVNLSGNVTGGDDTSATQVNGSVKITVNEKEKEVESQNNQETEGNTIDKESENETTNNKTETSAPAVTTPIPVETKKSNNANLSDLGIRPNDFKGFKPGNTSYNVTVPNDVEKVEIYAKTQDVNAKATGGGSKKLSVGDNSFNVTVTAEDGKTKKIYTINIKREEAVSEKNDTSKNEVLSNEVSEKEIANQTANEIAEETIAKEDKGDKGDLNKLDVQGYTLSPVFSPNVYEYKLTVSEDVTSLDVKAEATNSNVQVEIAGNKDLKEGENVITIMCYNKETKKNTTYQIIAEKKAKEDTHAEAINEAYKKRNLIIKVGIALIIILIVACIVVFKKDKEGNEKEFQQIEKDTKNEKETKHEIRNLNIEENMDNEEKPLAMQRKKAEIKKENISNVKTQKQREEEFDEKLQRIKNEKRKEQKGGKHF